MSKKAVAGEITLSGLAKRSVIYARVSSKEQEREGYSIPAQLKLLKEYAEAQNSRSSGNISTSRPLSRLASIHCRI